MAKSSKVFISYAHGDQAYQDRVLAFADRLELLGIEVIIDRYEPNPDQGWTKWMLDGVRKSDYVLCLCTTTYQQRVSEDQQPGTGLGSQWEGTALYNLLQSESDERKKVQVIQFDEPKVDAIPLPIRGNNRFVIKVPDLADEQFCDLYRVLTDQTLQRPPRGEIIELPNERRSTPAGLEVLPPRERNDPSSSHASNESRMLMGSAEFKPHASLHSPGNLTRPPGSGTYLQRMSRKRFSEAEEAYEDDRYADAVRYVEEARNLDGTLPWADSLLCQVYFASHQWQKAVEVFETRIRGGHNLGPKEQICYHIAQFQGGTKAGVREKIDHIAETNEINSQVRAYYCYFLDRIGERTAAKTLLSNALSSARDLEDIKTLAVLQWNDGNVAEATVLLEEAAKVQGDIALIWANLGVSRAEMRRFGLAIEALRNALAIRPRYLFALFALAEVYAMMGDVEAATIPLRELVANKYHGLSRLTTERTFDAIRDTQEFRDFIATIPKNLLSPSPE